MLNLRSENYKALLIKSVIVNFPIHKNESKISSIKEILTGRKATLNIQLCRGNM